MGVAVETYDEVVRQVSQLVHKLSGIQLNETQAHMVQSRLKTRMLRLGIKTPQDYLLYLSQNHQEESVALLSLLTTHHTFFFREFAHFEILESQLLPVLIPLARQRADKTIRIWSAACSRGQEVYSLAMFLDNCLARLAPDISFQILGSDVDPESVKIASNGVYLKTELDKVPMIYIGKNWAKGSGDIAHFVKISKNLRAKCDFKVVNLLTHSSEKDKQAFDVIFCRNVFIYFNEAQIRTIVTMMINRLEPSGRLFVGISETLTGLNIPMQGHGYSIYSKLAPMASASKTDSRADTRPVSAKSAATKSDTTKSDTTKSDATPTLRVVPSEPATKPAALLRVLCVDDSKSIQALMTKIFTKETGFEITGVAYDGQGAVDFLTKNTVDVVTLDIHMPGMDGLSYLQKHFHAKHPPVIMVSSVAREDAAIALKTLELGATDYVEKPSLNNLLQQAEELRVKVKMAIRQRGQATQAVTLEKQFAKDLAIQNQKAKARIIYCQAGHLAAVTALLKHWNKGGPSCTILLDVPSAIAPGLQQEWVKKLGATAMTSEDKLTAALPGKVMVGVWADSHPALTQSTLDHCLIVLGIPNASGLDTLRLVRSGHTIVEDMDYADVPPAFKQWRDKAQDIVPVASMAYMADLYFSRNG